MKMTNNDDRMHASIANLTGLWAEAAAPHAGLFATENFNYCLVRGSAWPNKLWFTKPITAAGQDHAANICTSVAEDITLPVWQTTGPWPDASFQLAGFEPRFEQVGMSLRPVKRPQTPFRFKIMRATTSAQFAAWEAIYPQAFGYRIDASVLKGAYENIGFYLAYDEGRPFGTAMLYQTGGITGIHGVGVIPEMRRQGVAAEIMERLLLLASESKTQLITLQASEMGKNLYLKLGFSEDYKLRTYGLKAT